MSRPYVNVGRWLRSSGDFCLRKHEERSSPSRTHRWIPKCESTPTNPCAWPGMTLHLIPMGLLLAPSLAEDILPTKIHTIYEHLPPIHRAPYQMVLSGVYCIVVCCRTHNRLSWA